MTGPGRDRPNGQTRPAQTGTTRPAQTGTTRDRPNGQTRPAQTGTTRDRPNGQTRHAQTGTTRPAQTETGPDRPNEQARPARTGPGPDRPNEQARPARTGPGLYRPNGTTRSAMACWASDPCDSDRAASVPPGRPESSATKENEGRSANRTTLVEDCVRRRPTLPRSGPRSTIGAERLSFRVRDGTGRFPLAMVAETLWRYGPHARIPEKRAGTVPREPHSGRVARAARSRCRKYVYVASPRPISTGQLHALPHFHFRPINPVV